MINQNQQQECFKVTLRLSSDMIANSNNETNFFAYIITSKFQIFVSFVGFLAGKGVIVEGEETTRERQDF